MKKGLIKYAIENLSFSAKCKTFLSTIKDEISKQTQLTF
jgi:hypothetical protein